MWSKYVENRVQVAVGRRAILLAGLLLLALGLGIAAPSEAAVAFKQSNFAVPQTSVSSVTVKFTSAQTVGDFNVVVVGWHDSTATVSSVVDTKGNAYAIAAGPTVSSSHGSETVYFATNIAAAAANGNTVTVTFSASALEPDVRIAEYSGIKTSSALDVAVSAVGTSGTAANSGSVTTTYANDLIVGADIAGTTTSTAGSGYTQRILTTTDKDILEDKTVTTAGSNSATATLTASSWWIMQLAAFKAADTTVPTTPTGLGASVISSTQINLSWTASTDNIGVTGYFVERCTGASCNSFTQIASLGMVTTYNDTTVAPTTTYRYRVRATDAAGNLSAYSSTVNGTTPADTTPPTAPSSLGATAASATQVNLTWTAATDNTGVTGYRIERCTGSGCSNFAQIASIAPGTSYSDTTVAPTTSYSYRVRAADGAGNLGGYSNTASATTPADTTAPSAPSGLGGTAISMQQINLSWTASTDNVAVTGYRVERCQGMNCSGFAQIASLGVVTTYNDTGLTPGTSYSYQVRATDAAGNLGAYSNTTTTSTLADTSPPTTPTGLTATAISSAQINLAWSASTDNVAVTSYQIQRCSGVSCSSFAALANTGSLNYSDTGVAASVSYTYQVRASDAAGNVSAYSASATAVTTTASATYTYDATGHLSTVTTSAGKTIQYTYDAAGNLIGIQTTP